MRKLKHYLKICKFYILNIFNIYMKSHKYKKLKKRNTKKEKYISKLKKNVIQKKINIFKNLKKIKDLQKKVVVRNHL